MFDENIFVISDTHFNHSNIGIYCNRPKKWKKLIIDNWNNTVKNDDIVIHLGDFAFGSKEKVKDLFQSLNGKKYLIRGNHDLRRGPKSWSDIGFVILEDPYHFNVNNLDIYLSHKPLINNFYAQKCICICGHWHNKSSFIWYNNNKIYVNVSVEQTNYHPLTVKSIIEGVYKYLETC